jgi:hypothetical protein
MLTKAGRETDKPGDMFEPSDLLRRDLLVLRATVATDASFCVLDELGNEIGHVVEEELRSEHGTAWLVVYDRENLPLLAAEKGRKDSDGHRSNGYTVIDGRGQLVATASRRPGGAIRDASGKRIGKVKAHSFSRETAHSIIDAAKTKVATYALGRPPQRDDRIGLTLVLTTAVEISSALRLAALGFAISYTDDLSPMNHSHLETVAKYVGVTWPGGTAKPVGR